MTSISDFRSIEEYRQLLRMNRLFFKYPVEGIRRWGLARLLEVRSVQLCHDCGYRNTHLTLRMRAWNCPECGARHDRDINAALNLRDATEYHTIE